MAGVKGQLKRGTYKMCTANDCVNKAKYKGMGLCSAHRNRLLRNSNFNSIVDKRNPAIGLCKEVNCNDVIFSKGLCKLCYQRFWSKENSEKVSAQSAKRRASIKNRTPNWLTKDDLWMIEEIYDLAKVRSNMFDFKWQVDHIIPLHGNKVSGFHVPSNLQVIPATINHQKGKSFYI